jgi:signal transduction histidine kinase
MQGLVRRCRDVRSAVGTHLRQVEEVLLANEERLPTQDLRRIESSITRMRRLTASVGSLADTLADLGEPPLSISEPCDANAVAERAIRLFRQSCTSSHVRFHRTPAARAFVIPQHIIQALREVLANAWEAAPDSGIDVEVHDNEDSTVIEVLDGGPGFGPKELRHATRPFVTDKPDRAGLGLYVAQSAVELSGGRLEIANRPDGGAAVSIVLPKAPPVAYPRQQGKPEGLEFWTDA